MINIERNRYQRHKVRFRLLITPRHWWKTTRVRWTCPARSVWSVERPRPSTWINLAAISPR